MRESPRLRRLRADLRAMEQLRSDSTILDFDIPGPMHGGPPETYLIRFHGEGLWRAVRNDGAWPSTPLALPSAHAPGARHDQGRVKGDTGFGQRLAITVQTPQVGAVVAGT